MSGLTPPGPGAWPQPEPVAVPGEPVSGDPVPGDPVTAATPGAPAGPNPAVRDALTGLSWVAAWFAVAGVLAALIWWQITPLAEYTRTSSNATMDEEQLAKQFNSDGWFFVIAAVGGLLSGFALLLLRRRNPVLMVVLVAVGGALATLVMMQVGLLLGPGDPGSALASTPVGGQVPLQLKTTAHGVWYVWSIAALVGGVVALWIIEARDTTPASPASGSEW